MLVTVSLNIEVIIGVEAETDEEAEKVLESYSLRDWESLVYKQHFIEVKKVEGYQLGTQR